MSPVYESALFVLTALAYVAATAVYFVFLFTGRGADSVNRIGGRLLGAGALMHAAHICVASLYLHVCPVEGIHFPVSVVAMLMCVVFLALRRRFRSDVLGAFVAPFALTALAASRMSGGPGADSAQHVGGVLLPVHIFVNVGGLALFGLAFAAATLYLIQERLLKRKRVEGLFQRLPPLDTLDRAEHKFLLGGFPLLTLGILTGTVWASKVEMGRTADLLRAGFGYAAWLLIAGVLVLRAAAGWRGRRAAYGTIAGFGFAMLVLVVYLVRAPTSAPTTADDARVEPPVAVAQAHAVRATSGDAR
jgi:ABC-type uncharacterized transport system permease subunit